MDQGIFSLELSLKVPVEQRNPLSFKNKGRVVFSFVCYYSRAGYVYIGYKVNPQGYRKKIPSIFQNYGEGAGVFCAPWVI